MQIENGKFYFISNTFIQKYGIKYNLMENAVFLIQNMFPTPPKYIEEKGIHVAFSNLTDFKRELLDK